MPHRDRRVRAASPLGSSRPPPYSDPWTEPLLITQNQTYGTAELGEIHTGTQKLKTAWVLQMICITFLLILGPSVGYLLYEPINREWHESIRRQWAGEENHWEIMREAWAVDVQKHEMERASMEEEHRKWDRQRREKEEKERQEKEEEARKRESIAWVGLEPGHCLRYRLKEYTATLSRVPLGIDGIEECWKKSVMIHGREWFPSQCEDQGLCGRVTGHWQVDMNEPSCTPWWDYPTDNGCTERGIRRYEAQLLNFQDYTDWPVICSTAPANINGTWYDRPTSCEHQGGYVWGEWYISDDTCR